MTRVCQAWSDRKIHNKCDYKTEGFKKFCGVDGLIKRRVGSKSLVKCQSRDKGEPGELVFNSKNGGRIREIYNSFDRVVNALGLNEGKTDPQNRVVFHTLRHTFASWLAIQGTPLHVIKELLGHKTLKMTERYSHLMPDVKKRAVQALEGAFREANSQGKVMELKTEEED